MEIEEVTVIFDVSKKPLESITFRVWLPEETVGTAIFRLAILPFRLLEASVLIFSPST